MSVCFTQKNIHVQLIDDEAGVTLAAVSTLSKSISDRDKLAANVTSAKRIGQLAAEAAKAKGIQEVVFDRGAARYHGKVKALADAAREAGLKF
jgi:large subunit ribosomal protein L18